MASLPRHFFIRCIPYTPTHHSGRICVVETAEPKLQVEGFATYTDVQASDMVPWTPLKAGYSHMDSESALFILRRVAPQFLGVVSSEAATLPEGEGECVSVCVV